MTEAVLLESRDGGILFLTMNRPAALNALDPSLARALRRSIAAAAEDPSVAVLVLRGSGRAFCAGGDISSMKASEEGVEADGDLEDAVRDLARALDSGPRIALSYIKQTMNLAETASLAEVMEVEALRHTHCRETEDHREAATAFAEKRTPRLAGR